MYIHVSQQVRKTKYYSQHHIAYGDFFNIKFSFCRNPRKPNFIWKELNIWKLSNSLDIYFPTIYLTKTMINFICLHGDTFRIRNFLFIPFASIINENFSLSKNIFNFVSTYELTRFCFKIEMTSFLEWNTFIYLLISSVLFKPAKLKKYEGILFSKYCSFSINEVNMAHAYFQTGNFNYLVRW